MISSYQDDESQSLAGMSSAQSDDTFAPPSAKRIKLEIPDDCGDDTYRSLYVAECERELDTLSVSHSEHNAELFFLEKDGNFMDYFAWRKRPNPFLNNYLESRRLSSDVTEGVKYNRDAATNIIRGEVKISTLEREISLSASPLTASVINSSANQSSIQKIQQPIQSTAATSSKCTAASSSSAAAAEGVEAAAMDVLPSSAAVLSNTSQQLLSETLSAKESTSSNPEGVVEVAKQEAQVLQRVAELRKNGMWSERRLPRIMEPARVKSQWDYLLEEMRWMAVDFAQERKWKICAAKQISDSVMRYHSVEEELRHAREEQELRQMRHKARTISDAVHQFWTDMKEMALHNRHMTKIEREQELLLAGAVSEEIDYAISDYEEEEESDGISEDADNEDWKKEVAVLVEESNMPIDKLVERYADVSNRISEVCESEDSTETENSVLEKKADAQERTNVWDIVGQVSRLKPSATSASNRSQKMKALRLRQPLREYQSSAVEWMKRIVDTQRCGWVLGDDDGLGKKVEMIALLTEVAETSKVWGPHLIIASSSSIVSWYKQFLSFSPAFKVVLYFGSTLERAEKRKQWQDGSACNVCLTTYQILHQDLIFFKSCSWKALLLAEVNKLKTLKTLEPVLNVGCERCVLLSDGHLTNKALTVADCLTVVKCLWSYDSRDLVERQLLEPYGVSRLDDLNVGTEQEQIFIQQLHKVIESLSLCRTKQELSHQLPELSETTVVCPASALQRSLYTQVVTNCKISEIFGMGDQYEVLKLIKRLQLVCNHPDLVQQRQSSSPLHVWLPSCSSLTSCTNIYSEHSLFQVAESSRYLDLIDLEFDPLHNVIGRPIRKSTASPLIVDITEKKTAESSDTFSMNVSDEHRLLIGSLMGTSSLDGVNLLNSNEMFMLSEEPLAVTRPLYGEGLRSAVALKWKDEESLSRLTWQSVGDVHLPVSGGDSRSANVTSRCGLSVSEPLSEITRVSRADMDCITTLRSVLRPRVIASLDDEAVSQFCSSDESFRQFCVEQLKSLTVRSLTRSGPSVIQSGKLQEVVKLLLNLRSEGRRAVVLSQFSAVLNLLEHILDAHYLLYLRNDSNQQISKQLSVTREFNIDSRYTCLLSSSRLILPLPDRPDVSTVILIDNDLRPSMLNINKQFITFLNENRNIDLYRFITEGTVEEKLQPVDPASYLLLQISAQDMSRSYSQDVVKKIFSNSLVSIDEIISAASIKPSLTSSPDTLCMESVDVHQLEEALDMIEDGDDLTAAERVSSHTSNLMEEFSGKLRLPDSYQSHSTRDLEDSSRLSMIEHYALSMIDNQEECFGAQSLLEAQPFTSSANNERLESVTELRKKFIQYIDDSDDVMLMTYPYDRENKQAFIDESTGKHMPLWSPPTPPHDDSDIYIDHTIGFLYGSSAIPESQLPPVYVKKSHKKLKLSHSHGTKQNHTRREEQVAAPRSLFDCPQMTFRYDRESRLMRLGQGQQIALKQHFKVGQGQVSGVITGPPPPPDQPDWLIHEDWALLQAFQLCQELPMKAATVSSAFVSNWEFISDVVNICSRAYRSAKQTRNRYENFILPREEGRLTYDVSPRKLKKSNKGLFKTKSSRPMRTNQLFIQDNNKASTTMFMLRFDSIKAISAKRSSTVRPLLAAPGGGSGSSASKNAKHTAVLQESGIIYDQPLTPIQVAAIRADRIAKEKKQPTAQGAAATTAGDQQQQQQQQTVHVAQQIALQHGVASQQQQLSAAATGTTTQLVLQSGQQLVAGSHIVPGGPDMRQNQQMTIVQAVAAAQQLQAANSASSTALKQAVGVSVTSVSGTSGLGMASVRGLAVPSGTTGIVVNPGNGQTYSLNKIQTISAAVGLAQTVRTVQTVRQVGQFNVKDAAGSVINQATVCGTGLGGVDSRPITQVITATSLTPGSAAQLVVTQQKPTIAVSQLTQGNVQQQQQLLSFAAGAKAGNFQQLQLRHRQTAALPQVRPTHLTTVQFPNVAAAAAGAATIQRTGTAMTPIITSLSQAQLTQLKGGLVPELFKRGVMGQQTKGVPVAQPQRAVVQQIQVSKTQLLEGIQLQTQQQLQLPVASGAIAGGMGSGSQTVATLIKTVSSAGHGTLPSLSIPVSAVNIGVSLGKVGTSQQIRQFQVQKRPSIPAMVQLPSGQHKVTALQQVGRAGTGAVGSLILQQQPQKVHIQPLSQPISQLLKQQQQQQQQNAQLAAATGASIAAQLGGNQAAGLIQSSTRTVSVAVASNPAALGVGGGGTSLQSSMVSGAAVNAAATVKLLTGAGNMATLIKPGVKESLLAVTQRSNIHPSPAAGVQPVTIRSLAATGQVITGGAGSQATLIQPVANRGAMPQATVVSQGVQQAVQEAVLAAQAQAQVSRQLSQAAAVAAAANNASTQAAAGTLQAAGTITQPATAGLDPLLISAATPTGSTITSVGGASGSGGGPSPTSDKSSAYHIRLRNQRS